MNELDPKVLFEMIASHLPVELHENVLIVGSLAAAYHYRHKLQTRAVNTKDADVVVKPANALRECREMAMRLLSEKWRRYPGKCFSQESPEPANELRAIRFLPPNSDAYYVELLGLPEYGQRERQKWVPVELDDGWYGLPCFRYFAVMGFRSERSEEGLFYATPAMMALANLLAHRELGSDTMSEPIGARILLRSAKDLGRVLALAHLAGREDVEQWLVLWRSAIETCFPDDHRDLSTRLGDGLRALLNDPDALEQARHANEVGLLRGRRVGVEALRAIGQRILVYAIEPLAGDFDSGELL